MKRILCVSLTVVALVLSTVSVAAAPDVVQAFTYPDCDPGNQFYLHWVQKIEYSDGSAVFVDLGEMRPVAHDGTVFWCQPLADQATFVAVYGPEVAPQAWASQHNLFLELQAPAPATAVAPVTAQPPPGSCPTNSTQVARILLELKAEQEDSEEVRKLAGELQQLTPANGWKFVASSPERSRQLMAHDTRVVDVNGVRYSQSGVWSPKTHAGTIWFVGCEIQ